MILEDQSNDRNQKLLVYNDFLRTLAVEKKCRLADLNRDMQAAVAEAQKSGLKKSGKGGYLTWDGVHMALAGDLMMATGVLKAFGLNAGEIEKAKEAWLDIPNVSKLSATTDLTVRQVGQPAGRRTPARASSTRKGPRVRPQFAKTIGNSS